MDNYIIWTKHGETQLRIESIIDERAEKNMGTPNDVYSHHDDWCEDDIGQDDADHGDEGFDVEELMRNIVPDVLLERRNKGFDNFEMLDKASRDLLYEECKGCDKKHTVLWIMLELLKLKASGGWFDTSFTALLELLIKVLPKPNGLLVAPTKQRGSFVRWLWVYKKIHACPNHCILYRKEHEFKDRCPMYNTSLYKQNDNSEEVEDDSNKKSKKGQGRKRKNVTPDQDIEGSKEIKVPAPGMWYLPMIDHLKRMFSNLTDAELLLWRVKCKMDGKIRHPGDGRQWKYVDLAHQEDFSNDPRNIRFGLSTDGMNPFREHGWNESIRRDEEPTQYVVSYYVHIQSPTMVVPLWKYLLLTTLVSSPK
jgi:hypothetical protein